MDKIKMQSFLDNRMYLANLINGLFDDLVDILDDPHKEIRDPFFDDKWITNATNDFNITDQEKLENALLQLYITGRQLLESEEYEKLQQLTNDYNKLKEIYEKRYGTYTRRQGGNAGSADSKNE